MGKIVVSNRGLLVSDDTFKKTLIVVCLSRLQRRCLPIPRSSQFALNEARLERANLKSKLCLVFAVF